METPYGRASDDDENDGVDERGARRGGMEIMLLLSEGREGGWADSCRTQCAGNEIDGVVWLDKHGMADRPGQVRRKADVWPHERGGSLCHKCHLRCIRCRDTSIGVSSPGETVRGRFS